MATYKPSRKKIERRYYAALNRIAENVGQLVESYDVVNYPQRASTVRQPTGGVFSRATRVGAGDGARDGSCRRARG